MRMLGTQRVIASLIIYGAPRTKKNSARIMQRGKVRFIAPSKQYMEYETYALKQIQWGKEPIARAVNLQCVYYMPTRRKVDALNLLGATDDILVKAGVLADDNSMIAATHDGSYVVLGEKDNPRVEIEISEGSYMLDADIERAAYNGDQLPDEIGYYGTLYYECMRHLYARFKAGEIDAEQAKIEKMKIQRECRKYKLDSEAAITAARRQIATEQARTLFRKAVAAGDTRAALEAASILVEALDGVRVETGGLPCQEQSENE